MVWLTLSLWLLAGSASAATLQWDRVPDREGVVYYNVYLCLKAGCKVERTKEMKQPNPVPQAPIGAIPSWSIPDNKVGAIAVTSVDGAGNESKDLSEQHAFDTLDHCTTGSWWTRFLCRMGRS